MYPNEIEKAFGVATDVAERADLEDVLGPSFEEEFRAILKQVSVHLLGPHGGRWLDEMYWLAFQEGHRSGWYGIVAETRRLAYAAWQLAQLQ